MRISTAPWRKVKVCLTSALGILLTLPLPAAAVNDLDLWLPASKRELMPQLRKAALAVEETRECDKVMRATLYEPSMAQGVPKFRLLCRDRDRRSYAVLVNSETLEISYPGRKPESVAVTPKMIQSFWSACEAQLRQKTKYMNKMQMLTQGMPKAETTEEGLVTMFVDFDAESVQRKPLFYRATCTASHEQPAKLTIKARPKS